MYGATVANLNVYMKQVGKPEALVWNLNGSQVHFISWCLKYQFDCDLITFLNCNMVQLL